MIRACKLIAFALLLGGCQHNGQVPPNLRAPVCVALADPIRYNSVVKSSGYYAGPNLAAQLRQRNAIGRQLGCAKYRV